MAYVDGFIIPIKKSKVREYKKMAQMGKKMWMKFGALDYKECVGHDLKGMGGTTFPKLARAKAGETVVMAYIVFKSKAQRDKINKKIMSDPSMKDFDPKDMPFNMKRMAYGGFKVLVG